MRYPRLELTCFNCDADMPALAFFNAQEIRGYKLCHNCYNTLHPKMASVSDEALALYFSLRKKGIDAELEKFDGFKKVDIAIESVKLYIEVDGDHHYTDHKQAIRDLQRTFHSLKDDYITIRIPNALIEEDLGQSCSYLTEMVRFRARKAG